MSGRRNSKGKSRRPGLLNRLPENGVVVRVMERIRQLQRHIADTLARRTAYWDRRSKVIAMAVFCLLFGGMCLWLMVRAWFNF